MRYRANSNTPIRPKSALEPGLEFTGAKDF